MSSSWACSFRAFDFIGKLAAEVDGKNANTDHFRNRLGVSPCDANDIVVSISHVFMGEM